MPTVRHYAASPNVVFGGPSSCVMRVRAWGWPPDRLVTLDRGETYQSGDVTITATFARHDVGGALAEDAVGFLLDLGGVRVWDVADTEYDSRLRSMRDQRIDVMFAPINGVGGNMSAHEAALLAWHVQPRIVSPMHYNMWAPEGFGPGATLDPSLLQETHGKLGGTAEVRILEPGKLVTLP
jgi:L-ascorbate metabolism protein UlaG (beta-lactamase superfamily)